MELSKIQKKVVEAKEPYVLVNSCAGSGKTRTLSERVKYLLKNGVRADKIVVITFTNAAAEEISERLDNPAGLFIGTIHSYANYLLLARGHDTSDILENEKFDRLFNRIKEHLDATEDKIIQQLQQEQEQEQEQE